MTDRLIERAAKIKLIGCDVDGVLTDGQIYLGNDGEVIKVFYAQDGMAMKRAVALGLKLVIITGRSSPIVVLRGKELDVTAVHLGVSDKLGCMKKIWQENNITPEETAFIGDDINDLPLLETVGLACTVQSGAIEVKKAAHLIAKEPPGYGAVREIIEFILRVQDKW